MRMRLRYIFGRLRACRRVILYWAAAVTLAALSHEASDSAANSSADPTRFVVVGCGRSGSTLLVSTLAENPTITSHREVFHKAGLKLGRLDPKVTPLLKGSAAEEACDNQHCIASTHSSRGHTTLLRLQRMHPPELIQSLWDTLPGGTKAVGFKLLKGHLQPELAKQLLLEDAAVKKVVILRQNVLARLFSLEAATTTGRWKNAHYATRMKVDVAGAVEGLASDLKWYSFIKEQLQGQEIQVVTYEELESDFAVVMERLSVWLGADPGFPYTAALKKQMDMPLEEAFLNMDEIRGALLAAGLPTFLTYENIPTKKHTAVTPVANKGGLAIDGDS